MFSPTIACEGIDVPPISNPPTPLYQLGCALAIILGIGALIAAGAGGAGFFKVGVFSQISQVQAILLMASGGAGGVALIILGSVGLALLSKKSKQTPIIYGLVEWHQLGIEIAENVPTPPEIDWDSKNPFYWNKTYAETCMLVYVPRHVKIRGQDKKEIFNLKFLERLFKLEEGSYVFAYIDRRVKDQFAETALESGRWVLMSRDAIPGSRAKEYTQMEKMVQDKGFRPPHILEMTTGIALELYIKQRRLFNDNPRTYTHCIEKISDNGKESHVVVGRFSDPGLVIQVEEGNLKCYGMAAVKSFETIN